MIFSSVEVPLGAQSYSIFIGRQLISSAGERIKNSLSSKRCAIITDSNVNIHYGENIVQNLIESGISAELVTVPAGETSKNLDQVGSICNRMINAGLDRSSFLVALGGGVVGDLAGFVAAIYYRGIPYIQIPTTVIAQVDSSIGGKTGVNTSKGKNLIGSFHQPCLVITDIDTLRTLPQREFNEGFAEVIKHAVICDKALFEEIAALNPGKEMDWSDLSSIILRNIQIKAQIVSTDLYEKTGQRALLNFGHTIGHAIENAAGYGRYFHGEAISLGIVAACLLSQRKAGLSKEENELILARLKQFELPTQLSSDISTESIMEALRLDKKFQAGAIRFVLCPQIGSAFLSEDVTQTEIRDVIEELR